MARLRAAQDHAAGDAARQAARACASRSCTAWSTSLVAEMGDAYPELGAQPGRRVKVVRGEEERFDAVLTGRPAPARGAARSREPRRRRGTLPGDEAFRLYDSLGVPRRLHRGPRQRAAAALRSRGLRAGDGGAARAGPRRSTFDAARRPRASRSRRTRARQRIEQTPDRFVGYDATTRSTTPISSRSSTQARTQVDALAAGASGFVVTDRTPFYLEAGGQVSDTGTLSAPPAASAGRRRRARRRRAAARPPRPGRRRGACAPASRVTLGGRRRAPRRHPPQPHRHAPAARGAAPDAGRAREAGRIAGGARSPALRLRASRRRSRPTRSRASSASSTTRS